MNPAPSASPGNGDVPDKSSAQPKEVIDDAVTGFPGLRSWNAVYACVLGVLVLYVLLLTVLTHFYQ